MKYDDSDHEALAPLAVALEHINQTMLNIQIVLPKIVFPEFELPEGLSAVLSKAGIEAKRCQRLENSGWLPHKTSPWELADDEDLGPEQLKIATESYYVSEWNDVSSLLIERAQSYDIDEEAKKAFGEAIIAHGHGLFRCAPRLLFPEIERISRREIHKGMPKTITSQIDLLDLMGDLTLAGMAPLEMADFYVYMKLSAHVYLQTSKSDQIEALLNDPVPNRHVALHGLEPYSTFQSSLNAIIITDFVFKAITKIKEGNAEIENPITTLQ